MQTANQPPSRRPRSNRPPSSRPFSSRPPSRRPRSLLPLAALVAVAVIVAAGPAPARAEPAPRALFASTEVLSPFVGGFDAELGAGAGRSKVAVEGRYLELPSIYNAQQDDFRVVYAVVELGYSRFLLRDGGGLFAAGVLDYYARVRVEHKASGEREDKRYMALGVRVGYLWQPSPRLGLYIEPSYQISVALGDRDVTLGGETYRAQRLQLAGPMFHLGWRFSL